MILRKINAWLSLITTVMFMNHAILNAVWMLSRGSVIKPENNISWILFGFMMVHAIISIVLAILGHKGAEKRKCNGYPDMNRPTYIQRGSGIALIPLTVLHILGTIGILHPPKVVHAILPLLFFTICLMHTAISTNKAFITLGIGNAKVIKVIDIAVKVLCGITLIADVTGFYLFLV